MNVILAIEILAAIGLLVFLILKVKLQPFLALLIVSIVTGLLAGLDASELITTIQKGMGGTLGFVATIVGLGAILGAILEASGSATALANYLLHKFSIRNAPLAMVITGFFIAIPVFFDVAFIILVPVLYALQKKTGKSLLLFGIPLLAGLAITHAFIPPTPGPVAVADIIGVHLGWVIISGFIAGIPTALISGLWFGKHIAKRINVTVPKELDINENENIQLPKISSVVFIIGLPIFLIVLKTITDSGIVHISNSFIKETILLVGHPFIALILANLFAWYILGIQRGFSKQELVSLTTKSLSTTGIIILLTGAGGVFKQVLLDTEIGKAVAEAMVSLGFPIIVFAFLAAAAIRVLQGSSTVAMITAAGLVSPLLETLSLSNMQLAALVTTIASGASIFSHVNDSGFWLVSQYLGLSEKQTFQSWTVMITILGCIGFIASSILFILF
ncbi:Gnt-I system low-affinity gluconate transporter [Pustulibacterium marinum]|uniref:Gnt-I system low-affinity gluconate transporter n=1 Tax=Pustulibacterium marinum TaxID=1224947 RepID=A0A1I7IPV6_9FLAO|nr:gluconate:H+ symporter [Pustulibacterium marinum]SFU74926.1 Gnt-I system low-affinity gluconate transporter [Pustulibacterium marinum]